MNVKVVGKPRLLLIGSLDEGLRCLYSAAGPAGFVVEHARPQSLRVTGAGPAMQAWKVNERLDRPDIVVHQNLKASEYPYALVAAWEGMGVLVVNSTQAGHANLSKWTQQQLFEVAGVPHPMTGLVVTPEHLYRFGAEVGYPFVVKPALSSGARGVVPIGESRHIRERVEPAMDGATPFIAQQFVTFRTTGQLRHRDRKAVVVGGRIVTVMERTGLPGEIAASRYGDERDVPLGSLLPEEHGFVRAAAVAVGMDVCSVDYWLTDDHPLGILINETNGFPALPPREAKPFASAVIDMLVERCSAPGPADRPAATSAALGAPPAAPSQSALRLRVRRSLPR